MNVKKLWGHSLYLSLLISTTRPLLATESDTAPTTTDKEASEDKKMYGANRTASKKERSYIEPIALLLIPLFAISVFMGLQSQDKSTEQMPIPFLNRNITIPTTTIHQISTTESETKPFSSIPVFSTQITPKKKKKKKKKQPKKSLTQDLLNLKAQYSPSAPSDVLSVASGQTIASQASSHREGKTRNQQPTEITPYDPSVLTPPPYANMSNNSIFPQGKIKYFHPQSPPSYNNKKIFSTNSSSQEEIFYPNLKKPPSQTFSTINKVPNLSVINQAEDVSEENIKQKTEEQEEEVKIEKNEREGNKEVINKREEEEESVSGNEQEKEKAREKNDVEKLDKGNTKNIVSIISEYIGSKFKDKNRKKSEPQQNDENSSSEKKKFLGIILSKKKNKKNKKEEEVDSSAEIMKYEEV
ncbi:MAG: hypothetical protein AAF335_04355 [Bacteroidota bacterium]